MLFRPSSPTSPPQYLLLSLINHLDAPLNWKRYSGSAPGQMRFLNALGGWAHAGTPLIPLLGWSTAHTAEAHIAATRASIFQVRPVEVTVHDASQWVEFCNITFRDECEPALYGRPTPDAEKALRGLANKLIHCCITVQEGAIEAVANREARQKDHLFPCERQVVEPIVGLDMTASKWVKNPVPLIKFADPAMEAIEKMEIIKAQRAGKVSAAREWLVGPEAQEPLELLAAGYLSLDGRLSVQQVIDAVNMARDSTVFY